MGYQALLFCPDEKTARVVTQVLTELDFSVEPAAEPFAAVKKLMAQHFDAIVVDCENEQNATLLFKSARNSNSNQASLAVAVVEGQVGVAKAFRIGANLVLTKPINIEQSKGTLRVARGLLRKGADAAKTAGQSSVPTGDSSFAPLAPGSTPAVTARPTIPVPTPRQSSSAVSANFMAPALSTSKSATVSTRPVAVPTAMQSAERPSINPDSTDTAAMESPCDSTPSKAAATASDLFENPDPSKTHPWQPVSKPAGPMASALQKAAEAAGKSPSAETPVQSPLPKPAAPPTRVARPSSPAQGAASAPAPAREAPKVSRISDSAAMQPVEPVTTTAATASKPKVARSAPANEATTVAAIATPSFSTLDSKESGASSSRKNSLFAVAAVAVLLTAAYFGYTFFHGRSGPSMKPVQAPVTAPQASPVPQTAMPATSPNGSTITPDPAPQAAQKVTTSPSKPSPVTTIAASKTAPVAPIAEDRTVVLVQSDPMVVKRDLTRPAAPSPAPQDPNPNVAPSALGIAGDPGTDLSSIATAPVSVPKPVPQVVNISQGVSQGLLLRKVQPTYPSQALTMRVEGAVQLQATISKDGNITNLKALSGTPLLTRAAMDAVRQWKYKPYYLNGEPVEVQTQIAVNFGLPK